LPSVDHPVHGRHVELGVKGAAALVPAAWQEMHQALHQFGAVMGPETVHHL
nr:competence/damage-inducible protein A [Alicycliphilus sp.]